MGHFKLASRTDLAAMKIGSKIEESDYATIIPGTGELAQFTYHSEEEDEKIEVEPGLYSLVKTMTGVRAVKTEFTFNNIIEDFVHTENVTNQVKRFFNKLHVYKEYGKTDVPRRGWLLWGDPGTGKSESIKKISRDLIGLGDVAVFNWPTDVIDPYDVKSFFKRLIYKNVGKQILNAEDIGGVEVVNHDVPSDPSLLSLLDNVEKSFTIPTAIIATTNHPEIFLGNLTDRPGRFDAKIEVPKPTAEERARFLSFFSNSEASEEDLNEIRLDKYRDLTPAHVKEVVFRSKLEDFSLRDSLRAIQKESEDYKTNFSKRKKSLGF